MGIESNAVLVRTVFSAYSTQKSDKARQYSVEEQAGSKHGKVTVKKAILSEWRELKKQTNIKQQVYLDHIAMTSPWGDDGVRILNSLKIFDYGAALQEARDKLKENEAALAATYDAAIQHDKDHVLKGLADNFTYPSINEIINSFNIESVFLPIPTSGDFRVEVPAEELARTQSKIDSLEEIVNSDIAGQIKKAVEHLKDILTREKTRIHGDSLIGGIKELAQRVEYLNVYDNQQIKDANRALHDLVDGVAIDYIKVSPNAKQDLAERADAFLKDFDGLF
jgi:molybdopterin converting factor small subunit